MINWKACQEWKLFLSVHSTLIKLCIILKQMASKGEAAKEKSKSNPAGKNNQTEKTAAINFTDKTQMFGHGEKGSGQAY